MLLTRTLNVCYNPAFLLPHFLQFLEKKILWKLLCVTSSWIVTFPKREVPHRKIWFHSAENEKFFFVRDQNSAAEEEVKIKSVMKVANHFTFKRENFGKFSSRDLTDRENWSTFFQKFYWTFFVVQTSLYEVFYDDLSSHSNDFYP